MDSHSNSNTRDHDLDAPQDRYQMLFENNPIVIWEHDFSEAKAYIDEIPHEADDFRTYLDANPAVLGELFDRVRTIGVNQNAVDYYGAESKEQLLNNVDQVLDEEAWELTKDLWSSVAAGETRFKGETVAKTFDGNRQHQILNLYVPEAHADDYELVYMTGTDITEVKQRERELKRERDRLDEFASIVSHDLRNPLNAALSRLNMARSEYTSETLDGAANGIKRSLDLIDNLLSLARAGGLVSETEPIELADVVHICWTHLETVDADLTTDVDATIRADRSRLSQLLDNLFRNAVEHGGTDVTISVGQLADGMYVADDGSGIPVADTAEIFHAGFSTTQDGTGFGLNIVKQVADAHQWEISVTESHDGGARFEITGIEFVD